MEATCESGEITQLAFPDGEDFVAEALEGAGGLAVAVVVAGEFGEPVGAPEFGDSAAAAGVGMPEAAVDEDDFFCLGKVRSGVPGRDFWWRR